ncbi:MAG: hypothetical protein HY842_05240 [Bacteroidetes bacterium]|nr:hypothetical protein [Bacteroidota bacterium]
MDFNLDAPPAGIFDFEIFPLKENMVSEGEGNNRKGLFVAIAGAEEPSSKDFLAKVLQAAGFDLAEDALTFWATSPQPFCFTELRHQAGFSHALFFGVPPMQAGLQLNLQPNQPLTVGEVTYLFSASLTDIQASPALKRPLWEGLKAMFQV